MSSFEESTLHGQNGIGKGWSPPDCVTNFDVNARLTFTNIKAHEYVDTPNTMREKVSELAKMIRNSQNLITYTGAGISTSAGIDDYATKAKNISVSNVGKPILKDWKKAKPTLSHHVLVSLYKVGFLKYWIQQNHDSLPQKAGYPQYLLNEIHGSLHDPSNPIVPYEGSLRNDLFHSMEKWKIKSDLCLALGTSLSGFNADSVAESASSKFLNGEGLGLVIINLQETPYDDTCALRIFGKIDDVMMLLAEELEITSLMNPMDYIHIPSFAPHSQLFINSDSDNSDSDSLETGGGGEVNPDIVLVPFDENGWPLATPSTTPVATPVASSVVSLSQKPTPAPLLQWDLRIGKRVRLTGGPYEGDIGTIVEKNNDGHYRIRFSESVHPAFNVLRRPFSLWLGNWHLAEASYGFGIEPGGPIPFVNVHEE
mmetsp:Transcript_6014/g.7795  ORF Transcript_6014/g.7795 Transcript_6014/m.7795 type:complete len:426 (-) Transcript_6014:63-1340(-)